jgi:hypothetical protein
MTQAVGRLQTISRFWSLSAFGSLGGLALYQVVKVVSPWQFDGRLARPDAWSLTGLFCTLVALGAAACLVLFSKRVGSTALLVSALLISASGFSGAFLQIRQQPGKETSNLLGFSEISREGTVKGPITLIQTWNARANPRTHHTYFGTEAGWSGIRARVPDGEAALEKIERYGDWVIGGAWDDLDRPQSSRAYMHPPLYWAALAAWMMVFGQYGPGPVAFVLLVKLALVWISLLWGFGLMPREEGLSRLALTLSIATFPPLLMNLNFFYHELAFLMALLGGVVFQRSDQRMVGSICAGVLLGLASYTSFFALCFSGCVVVTTVLLGGARDRSSVSWLVAGVVLVALVFYSLGYYPWLTLVTGLEFQSVYREQRILDLSTSVMSYLYLGTPALLFFLALLSDVVNLRVDAESGWVAGAVVSALLVGAFMFGVVQVWRYLAGFIFLMTPGFARVLPQLKLSRHAVLSIPIANLGFVGLVQFL